MRFEWDDAKAAANLRKHGVSFEEAAEVFCDPNASDDYDPEHSDEEARFFIIGLSSRRMLYVVYAERADDVVRIISARRASKFERKIYERERIS
ncbi:MAG: BrnT family toxin [Acidobacteria bacterium]|nr:BrnT family toxin [Acidobacteriota bacterium]